LAARPFGTSKEVSMRLRFVHPWPQLRPYIESFWIFESTLGLPAADASIAVPNGCAKLIVPYQNSLWSRHPDDGPKETREHGLYFVGVQEAPTFLASAPRKTGFIAVEFRPHGAYRFLNLPMIETTNGLYAFEELRGRDGRTMRETLCNLDGVNQKIQSVQAHLTGLLRDAPRSFAVVDYVVGALKATGGRSPLKKLEEHTGYSRRYLERLFGEQVGVSPKALARIFRFQRFYEKWARGERYDQLTDELYDYYYDQAHFAKEFKQFTGYPPRRFAHEIPNEFGRRSTLR
jgi:AraC-like DNA-binding protein